MTCLNWASVGSLVAVGVLSCATAESAQTPSERSFAVSDLVGRSPAEVRSQFVAGSDGWPLQPAFETATPKGVLTFYAFHDLLLDPAAAERDAMFRTHADHFMTPQPVVECRTERKSGKGGAGPAATTVLEFSDGRLEAVFQPVFEPPPPIPVGADRKTLEAFQKEIMRRPRSSEFLAEKGGLPLADGPGFLDRWKRDQLEPSDKLSAGCSVPAPQTALPGRSGPSAHDALLGAAAAIAFAPVIATLPAKNAQRTRALGEGHALIASMRPGAPLGDSAEAFASSHRGVRAYLSRVDDYAILSVDLGGYASRNVTNFNDVALVGVRNGVVEWISPPSMYGPRPDLLCLDEHGAPGPVRPGCNAGGRFSP